MIPLLLLLKITLVAVDSHYPNRVFWCLESRVFPDGMFYCYQRDNEPTWIDLNERPTVVVTEPINMDPYAR